ncbi:MAG TPA: response regulator [Kofleriaceae bacterium]|nr:response regulator [Kofleriaceae bacterium]
MPASILVVDDNRDAADLMGEALRMVGYTVRVAHEPTEALAMLDDFTPDAALLDIGLPGIDGYTLAGELHRRLPALPLIAITGYGQANDRARAVAAGFAAHFVKPASIHDLVAVLERLLA